MIFKREMMDESLEQDLPQDAGFSLIELITTNPFFFSWFIFMCFCGAAFYATRERWLPDVLDRLDRVGLYRYVQVPTSFREDVEAGLHSDTFDLTGNITDGDSRAGLDYETKREIMRLMKKYRCTFDEARGKMFEEQMRKAGIGPDGMPLDRRAVNFSSLNGR